MTDISTPHTEAECQAALSFYVAETQHLIDQMQTEQVEIDRLKESGHIIRAEIDLLRTQARDILAPKFRPNKKLEATRRFVMGSDRTYN